MSTQEHDTSQSAEPRRHYGKYPGLVLDNASPDGAHRGRIKVQVPALLEETPDGQDSQPMEVLADPCLPPGFFFIPEKGAQVWVEFATGDINFPLWTGVWYPEGATPKASGGSDTTEAGKVIRTRTGQVIHLDDTDGSEKIVINDEKNQNQLTLDADGICLKRGQSSLVLKEDSVVLSCQGKELKLDAGGLTYGGKYLLLETFLDLFGTHGHISGGPNLPTTPDPGLTLQLQDPTSLLSKV